ncbi:unnamed protein product [Amoebophrya sp. A25]|nr:unnamed protein product [Amoebophrya sp. A25]|eukprot:GSA25T00005765001.1
MTLSMCPVPAEEGVAAEKSAAMQGEVEKVLLDEVDKTEPQDPLLDCDPMSQEKTASALPTSRSGSEVTTDGGAIASCSTAETIRHKEPKDGRHGVSTIFCGYFYREDDFVAYIRRDKMALEKCSIIVVGLTDLPLLTQPDAEKPRSEERASQNAQTTKVDDSAVRTALDGHQKDENGKSKIRPSWVCVMKKRHAPLTMLVYAREAEVPRMSASGQQDMKISKTACFFLKNKMCARTLEVRFTPGLPEVAGMEPARRGRTLKANEICFFCVNMASRLRTVRPPKEAIKRASVVPLNRSYTRLSAADFEDEEESPAGFGTEGLANLGKATTGTKKSDWGMFDRTLAQLLGESELRESAVWSAQQFVHLTRGMFIFGEFPLTQNGYVQKFSQESAPEGADGMLLQCLKYPGKSGDLKADYVPGIIVKRDAKCLAYNQCLASCSGIFEVNFAPGSILSHANTMMLNMPGEAMRK